MRSGPEDGAQWVRGTRCLISNCVEVARLDDGRVAIRSSHSPGLPATILDGDEWTDFLHDVQQGTFDGV